ncbi:cytoplasmic dynein 2 intermediate chain 2-like isoform X1 [Cotesia glomerata]|uniref:cytoplasmic dynein 2 intermediate chain 2-like isoform X1 n=1 Tax=Cotesia glomerata TaxID=32391 RepID=UPI001D02F320|nr:cytoplasmic dynein 2 intermediate chain 2-like isoform X1 [Cotesia glomerata]
MFTNKSNDAEYFPSTITTESEKSCQSLQTDDLIYKNKNVQSNIQHSVETQTEAENQPKEIAIDYGKLSAFLKKVTPKVLEALDEIYDNHTINSYEPIGSRDNDYQLKLLNKFSTIDEFDSQKKISSLSWSKNGGTLAVGYSNNHTAWCDHQSRIKFYNLERNDDKLHQDAVKNYETNSCVTCLSFHPIEPSIIAAGLFNGDVLLWNIADTLSQSLSITVHNDVVTSLMWRRTTINTDSSMLITTSADGFIYVNKLIDNFTNSKLQNRFKIIKEHNPAENSRPPSASGRHERTLEPGLSITCLDISYKNNEIFIVGTLCGGMYKCNFNATTPVQGDNTLIDPVIDEYERCDGSIVDLKCLDTQDIFVASNSNKEIRIFNITEMTLTRIINVEFTVTGLGSISNVIVCYGADDTIKFFNTSGKICELKIKCQNNFISSVDLSIKRDTIAIGDILGNLEVWKIPPQTSMN